MAAASKSGWRGTDQGDGPRDGREARGLLGGELQRPTGELDDHRGGLALGEEEQPGRPAQDAETVMGHPRDLLGSDALLAIDHQARVDAPQGAGLVLGLELQAHLALQLQAQR